MTVIKASQTEQHSFYESHRRVVFDFALRRLGNVPDAENVVQEAFARTLDALRTQQIAHPRAYLLRTAANLATDLYRRRQRESPDPPDVQAPATSGREDHQRIRDAVATLPAALREVLTLRYGESLSFSAMAKELQLSKNAAHHRHRRALEELRRVLGMDP